MYLSHSLLKTEGTSSLNDFCSSLFSRGTSIGFFNSTSDIRSLQIFQSKSSSFYVSETSSLRICCSNLHITFQLPNTGSISCSGRLTLFHFEVSLPNNAPLFNSLVDTCIPFTYTSSTVRLEASHIRNILFVSHGSSFLSKGSALIQSLYNCEFINITSCLDSINETSISDQCTVSGSVFVNGNEGIYGEIVSGLTDNTRLSFRCLNSSFLCCTGHPDTPRRPVSKNEDYTYQDFDSRLRISSTSFTISYCTFKKINASNQGGAIYASGSIQQHTAEITRSDFDTCIISYYSGGAIYLSSFLTCSLTFSTFTNCSSPTSGGAVYIGWLRDCLALHDCIFQKETTASEGTAVYITSSNMTGLTCDSSEAGLVYNCEFTNSLTNSSGGRGTLYIGYCHEASVRSCSFYNCTTAGIAGGLLAYCYQNDTSVVVYTCSFMSCTATKGGAVTFFNPQKEQLSLSTWFYSCQFGLNSAPNGADLFIQLIGTNITNTVFDANTYTITNTQNRVFLSYSSGNTNYTYDDWLPFRGYRTVAVESSLTDSEMLCTSLEPCKSILDAYNGAVDDAGDEYALTISMLEGYHAADLETIDIDTHSMSLVSSGTYTPVITMTNSFAASAFF